MVYCKMASRPWAGFSEEELKLLRTDLDSTSSTVKNPSAQSEKDEERNKNVKVIRSFQKAKRANSRQDVRKTQGIKKTDNMDLQEVTEDMSLTKTETQPQVQTSNRMLERCNSAGTVLKVDSESLTYEILPLEDNNSSPSKDNISNEELDEKRSCPILNNDKVESQKNGLKPSLTSPLKDLNSFEQRQKRMEADNAKRRELLLKAIDDRKKRTEEEGKKIIKVQAELGKLDSMLSNDVGILRREIETASLDFSDAQKRYDKAEKEFVESKLMLFQKMERKERLTEHLCTIIEQNEARKARKLGELMHELDLGELYEECKANGMNMILPQLCALNNLTYNTMCNTIKPPHTPSEIISIMPQDKTSESNKKHTQEQLPPPDDV